MRRSDGGGPSRLQSGNWNNTRDGPLRGQRLEAAVAELGSFGNQTMKSVDLNVLPKCNLLRELGQYAEAVCWYREIIQVSGVDAWGLSSPCEFGCRAKFVACWAGVNALMGVVEGGLVSACTAGCGGLLPCIVSCSAVVSLHVWALADALQNGCSNGLDDCLKNCSKPTSCPK